MLGMLLTIACSALPVPTDSVGVLPIRGRPDDSELAAFASATIARALTDRGLHVVPIQDALERLGSQRSDLACDTKDCTRTLAQRIGVATIVRGEVTREGDQLQIEVRAYAGDSAEELAVARTATKDRAGFASALDAVSSSLVAQLMHETPPKVIRGGLGVWLPAGLGVALVAAGGALVGIGTAQVNDLTRTPKPGEMPLENSGARTQFSNGRSLTTIGATLMGLGGISLGVAIAVYFSAPVVIVPITTTGIPGLTISWATP